jgi:hypothetical protein
MKKIFLPALMVMISFGVYACPICDKQQPKILRGFVHGGVPESSWDYIIVWSVAVITAITLFFTVKWIVKPGEKNANHIKYAVLNFE